MFWFSWKIVHVYISGREKKNKLKEKHMESSEKLVNRVPTSLNTSFVSVNFGNNISDSCTAFRCTNWRSATSLQFYCTPSAKQYLEQRITKWVTTIRREKGPAKKINNAQISSAHCAIDKPSWFSKAWNFPAISFLLTKTCVKRWRRPNKITSKICTAPYICSNSRMASLHYFHFFTICRNYFPFSVLLFFYF